MGFIPKNAKWYLADIVIEITVEGDPGNVVHTNVFLVRADSPEEAYEKALILGADQEQSYDNPAGQLVAFRFRGLRDLTVLIDDELGDGTELSYTEDVGMTEADVLRWVSPKEELGVFQPIAAPAGPNYSSGDIMRRVDRMLRGQPLDDDLNH